MAGPLPTAGKAAKSRRRSIFALPARVARATVRCRSIWLPTRPSFAPIIMWAGYYVGWFRPRAAYSMGLIHRWSRIAGEVPWLANFFTQTPGLAGVIKWTGGIAQQRSIPRYAGETFAQWFRKRPQHPANGRRVLLWPDTFNN